MPTSSSTDTVLLIVCLCAAAQQARCRGRALMCLGTGTGKCCCRCCSAVNLAADSITTRVSKASAVPLPSVLELLLVLQARTELQKEVLDILSAGQPTSADPNLRASSKLLQPSTPAVAAPSSPADGKILLLQRSSSLDGTHSYKADQSTVIVPVLPNCSHDHDHDRHPASSGSITRAWLADIAHRAHDQERGCKALVAHFRQAARVSPPLHPVLISSCTWFTGA